MGAWSNGSFDARAIAGVLKDPMSLFAARSPGERAPGALTQTKPARGPGARVQRLAPRERVLSSGRARPGEPVETAAVETPVMTIDPVEGIGGGLPVDGLGIGDPGIIADGGGGGGGAPFFVPPTSIGPGVGAVGDPGPGVGVVTPPTSPVPEPETWLMMMIGLFTIGGALRRKRAASAMTTADVHATHGEEAASLTSR